LLNTLFIFSILFIIRETKKEYKFCGLKNATTDIMLGELYMGNLLVSIVCTAYNHEKYIADAIESFLMQETEFAYEILIHDDASTDRTPDIIREYAIKHPDLIKPIYQIENKYSKGIKISSTYIYPNAQGKYIAKCEGDDYWTDKSKLQLQVEYMESHPECALCFHAAEAINVTNGKILSIRPYKQDRLCPVEDIILGNGTLYCATNSMLFPLKLLEEKPVFRDGMPTGDYPLRLQLASKGTVYYINRKMSVYRTGVPGSWVTTRSEEIKNKDYRKAIEFQEKVDSMMCLYDEYTNYEYSNAIQLKRIISEANFLKNTRQFDKLKNKKYQPYWNSLGHKEKIKLIFKRYMPVLYYALKRFKS